MAMAMLLRRMGRADITVHGFDRHFGTGLGMRPIIRVN
jgi:hypothetical protein